MGAGEPGRRALRPPLLFGSTAPQYVTWLGGTAVGALAGERCWRPDALGLDAIFPAFFVGLLVAELRSRQAPRSRSWRPGRARARAITPPGVPVLAASLAALRGLRRGERDSATALGPLAGCAPS